MCNPHTLVTELGPDTKVCQIRGDVIDFPLQVVDAYELLGQVGEVRVHQTLDHWNAVLVKLDKRYLGL